MDNTIRTKLVLDDARAALDWYATTLSAEIGEVFEDGGAVVHASLTVLGTRMSLKDADVTDPSYAALGAPGILLEIVVDAPDAIESSMLAGGAESVFPVADQVYGARAGRVRDPFGVQWLLTTPLKG